MRSEQSSDGVVASVVVWGWLKPPRSAWWCFTFDISRHRAWQIVRDCAKKAGLPQLVNSETGKTHNISPHRLRDSFAVHAVKLDDSSDGLRMLQEHLGHQSITTTMKYRKLSGEELKEWYQRLWRGDKT